MPRRPPHRERWPKASARLVWTPSRGGVPCSAPPARGSTSRPSWIAPGPKHSASLLFQSHPHEIDRILADVARLVPFAQVDGGHPPDFTVRRGRGVGMFALALRSRRPLTAFDVDVKHVRMVCVHALPLTGIHGEALHDH